jgi:hypothetical protein
MSMTESKAESESKEEIINIDLPSLILSPKFQALAGPLGISFMLIGVVCTYSAMWFGFPRPVLFAAFGLGIGVAIASVAVTLGVILLVAKQTPYRRRALLSIALGIATFVLAGPVFVLIWASNT